MKKIRVVLILSIAVILLAVSISVVITLDNNEEVRLKRPLVSYSRYVFLEIPKADFSCISCQRVTTMIEDLFASGKYPFYYVLLPENNIRAGTRRLEFNFWAYPTIYIDGGYDVIVGSNLGESDIARKIVAAADSQRANITISTQAILNQSNSTFKLTSYIQNNESNTYNGSLLIYLTEINSSGEQSNSQTHFILEDFPVYEHLSIPPKDNVTIEKWLNRTSLDSDNILFYSVVFTKETHTRYSQPPDKNPFDAHYLDAIDATRIE